MSRQILAYDDLDSQSPKPQPNATYHTKGGPDPRPYKMHQKGKGKPHDAADDERKKKKRRFEESLEHDRVHWDAQGQREYGTVEVNYDDGAGGGSNAEAARPSSSSQGHNSTYGTNGRSAAATTKLKKETPSRPTRDAPANTSAMLTDADAWDDSYLINAWDAAMEEYQILNGPEADWKKDPVHKDSIWYRPSSRAELLWEDVKPASSTPKAVGGVSVADLQGDPEDEGNQDMEEEPVEPEYSTSQTAVETALHADADQMTGAVPPAPYDISKMSKDELFQKAVEASYWAGYWAAAYHASGSTITEQ